MHEFRFKFIYLFRNRLWLCHWSFLVWRKGREQDFPRLILSMFGAASHWSYISVNPVIFLRSQIAGAQSWLQTVSLFYFFLIILFGQHSIVVNFKNNTWNNILNISLVYCLKGFHSPSLHKQCFQIPGLGQGKTCNTWQTSPFTSPGLMLAHESLC